MKKIRNRVFETNSSSCHSITIDNTNISYYTIYPDSEGIITLRGGEFGWEIADYNDPLTKAEYCAQSIVQSVYTPTDSLEFRDENKKEMLIKVIEEHTGAKVEFNALSLNDGYIDHQSNDVADEAFYSEENLKNFIFNRNSVLYTDNDNH
jgi:hypothetical protein